MPDADHRPAAPGGDRRGAPLEWTRGARVADAGQGHHETPGQGARGKPRKQARGLTKEALAAVKATARVQRVDQGKHRRKGTESQAAIRAAVDLAILEVMRDGLLRGSEASALRWGDFEFHAGGPGRLHVLRSKTDQTADRTVLYLGSAAGDALLAIRPNEAVIDSAASVLGLSSRQISRRIKAATKMAGLGDGFSGHSPRVGMAQDLSAAGAELPELMTAGRWRSPMMPAKYIEAQSAGGVGWLGITGVTCGNEPQTL